MAQFDVYKNKNQQTNQEFPYILDIQNDILTKLSTRVVVPLSVNKAPKDSLYPKFIIEDQEVTMYTTFITSLHLYQLEDKICSLQEYRASIIAALDFLVTGY